MSDQEIFTPPEIEPEEQTLFDELAVERQAEYYRVIAHTRTLSPNNEMLRILEAMGILALITRETPGEIAAERQMLRKIMEASAAQASAVEEQMEQYASRLESGLVCFSKSSGDSPQADFRSGTHCERPHSQALGGRCRRLLDLANVAKTPAGFGCSFSRRQAE